jgi:hypothetical protein
MKTMSGRPAYLLVVEEVIVGLQDPRFSQPAKSLSGNLEIDWYHGVLAKTQIS